MPITRTRQTKVKATSRRPTAMPSHSCPAPPPSLLLTPASTEDDIYDDQWIDELVSSNTSWLMVSHGSESGTDTTRVSDHVDIPEDRVDVSEETEGFVDGIIDEDLSDDGGISLRSWEEMNLSEGSGNSQNPVDPDLSPGTYMSEEPNNPNDGLIDCESSDVSEMLDDLDQHELLARIDNRFINTAIDMEALTNLLTELWSPSLQNDVGSEHIQEHIDELKEDVLHILHRNTAANWNSHRLVTNLEPFLNEYPRAEEEEKSKDEEQNIGDLQLSRLTPGDLQLSRLTPLAEYVSPQLSRLLPLAEYVRSLLDSNSLSFFDLEWIVQHLGDLIGEDNSEDSELHRVMWNLGCLYLEVDPELSSFERIAWELVDCVII